MTKTCSPDCLSSGNPEIAAMLKALGHPVRLAVVEQLLSRNCCCCGELCDCFDHSQSTISQHLSVLKEAGLLNATKEGNRMLYSVNEDAFVALGTVFEGIRKQLGTDPS